MPVCFLCVDTKICRLVTSESTLREVQFKGKDVDPFWVVAAWLFFDVLFILAVNPWPVEVGWKALVVVVKFSCAFEYKKWFNKVEL